MKTVRIQNGTNFDTYYVVLINSYRVVVNHRVRKAACLTHSMVHNGFFLILRSLVLVKLRD